MKKGLANGMSRLVMALSLMMLLISGVKASAAVNDLGALEVGKSYELTAFNTTYGTFTATESGQLVLSSTGSYVLEPFKAYNEDSAAMTAEDNVISSTSVSAFPRVIQVDVTAGETIVLYCKSPFDACTVTLSMAGDIPAPKFEFSVPEEGAKLTLDKTNISVKFSDAVACSGVTIATGSVSKNVTSVSIINNIIGADVKSILTEWYADGTIKGGESIKVTFSGIESTTSGKKYGDNGEFVLNLVAVPNPAKLVSANFTGDKFLSFFPTTGEAGVLKMEFTEEISSAEAMLSYGNVEQDGGSYIENVVAKINGKSVEFDFRGKLRRVSDMISNTENTYSTIALKVSNVKDVNGNLAMSEGAGTVSSWTYTYDYEEVAAVDLVSEFTPASGAFLTAENKSVEVWINGVADITFSGFKYDYELDGTKKSVTITDFSSEVDPDNAATAKIFNVAIPEEVVAAKNVVLSLADLQCKDGVDRSGIVCAKYNSFVITSSTPANYSSMLGFNSGDVLSITTNMDDKIGYMLYEIIDVTADEIIKSEATLTKGDAGWTAEFYSSYEMEKGHTYNIHVYGYEKEEDTYFFGAKPIAEDNIVIYGLTPAFEYSSITFQGITPDPESYIIEDLEDFPVTLTFDGLVQITDATCHIVYGFGDTLPLASVAPEGEAVDGYCDKWTLTIGADAIGQLSGQVWLMVQAFDEEGKLVQGNDDGEKDQSYLSFSYSSCATSPEITFSPAARSEVSFLEYIDLSCDEGISRSWATSEKIRVVDAFRNVVSECTYTDGDPDDDYIIRWGTITLTTPISEPGTYYLEVPYNYFSLGSEFETYNSRRYFIRYDILEEVAPLTTNPADGEEVDVLSEINITYDGGYVEWGWSDLSVEDIVVYEMSRAGRGEVVAKGAEYELYRAEGASQWDYYIGCKVKLNTEVTKAGAYQIVIPAALLKVGENADLDNEEQEISVVVSGAAGISDIFGDDVTSFTVFDAKGVKLIDNGTIDDVKTLTQGIYIINGEKVIVK